jgi:membrane protein YdbS with pleckstrin-like domain
MSATRENVLFEAKFDPKWKVYFFIRILLLMIVTILGILLVPFWLLGWGQWYCRRYYESLRCVLCERSLVIGRGIWFRRERTIPLDKIQDLTLLEGPLLDRFGLCQLNVETAGQNVSQGGSEASLIGIVEARSVRDRVLDQRDLITGRGDVAGAAPEPGASVQTDAGILVEIRDSLGRIEKLLARE